MKSFRFICFIRKKQHEEFFSYKPDYVIDASDTISYKIHLIKECVARGVKIISSMGAANKMDPTRFQIADISKTHTDPVAKVIRLRLRKEGIHKGVPVVFSDESPLSLGKMLLEQSGSLMRQFGKRKCHPHRMHSFHP